MYTGLLYKTLSFMGMSVTGSLQHARKSMFRCVHSTARRNAANSSEVAGNTANTLQHPVDEDNTDNIERWELLQKVKGLDDPFQMTAKTVTAGTRDNPTLISTIYDQRTVGCICKDDSQVIKWMKLNVGENKKCECGYWFKLVPLEE